VLDWKLVYILLIIDNTTWIPHLKTHRSFQVFYRNTADGAGAKCQSGCDNTDIDSSQTSTAETWNLPRCIDKGTMSRAVTDRQQSKWIQTRSRSQDVAYRDTTTYPVIHTFLENHVVTRLVKSVALLHYPHHSFPLQHKQNQLNPFPTQWLHIRRYNEKITV